MNRRIESGLWCKQLRAASGKEKRAHHCHDETFYSKCHDSSTSHRNARHLGTKNLPPAGDLVLFQDFPAAPIHLSTTIITRHFFKKERCFEELLVRVKSQWAGDAHTLPARSGLATVPGDKRGAHRCQSLRPPAAGRFFPGSPASP